MKSNAKKAKPEVFVKKALEYGAFAAKIIRAKSVVTAEWVRFKCQFGCDGFNTNLCCPPHTPTPGEMKNVIKGYKMAILMHFRGDQSPTEIVVMMEKALFLSGFYKALGLGAGPCMLCKKCNKQTCSRPEEARPSMEACGIDVYATARGNGFPIDVLKNKEEEGNYFGLVFIE